MAACRRTGYNVEMKTLTSNYRLFLKEFRRTFHTTGAILPSGRALGRALAKQVRKPHDRLRILEVGPGTGAVTTHLAQAMGPRDSLDLVELNDRFVARLQERFASDRLLQPVASQTAIHHAALQDLEVREPFDVIVSGLPLNNFAAADVQAILSLLLDHLRPGGHLSFFEYIAIRRVKSLLASQAERQRLRDISHALGELFENNHWHRQPVVANVPPAWAHHVEKRSGESS